MGAAGGLKHLARKGGSQGGIGRDRFVKLGTSAPSLRTAVEKSGFDGNSIHAHVKLEIQLERVLVPSRISCPAGSAKDGSSLAKALERVETRGMLVGDQGKGWVRVGTSAGGSGKGDSEGSPARRNGRETVGWFRPDSLSQAERRRSPVG